MANEKKITSNSNIDVWVVPVAGIANPAAPTKAEIEAGIYLSPSVAWDSFELAASDSNDIDDRSIIDVGNATSRGYASFSATIPLFRESNVDDVNSDYNKAYNYFKVDRQACYLVMRVNKVAAPTVDIGDVISVYKFIADAAANDTEGEDSIKLIVNFLPQGVLYVNTLVKATTGNVAVTPATLSVAVGAKNVVKATLATRNYTQGVTWTSSNTGIATVTPNGVVTGISAGSATITATHPAAGSGSGNTVAVTVTA